MKKLKIKFLIELIIGFLDVDFKLYKQFEFENTFGELDFEEKNGVIIKIPRKNG